MTIEFVVDADVWGHSDNPTTDLHEAALQFVHFLAEPHVRLAFDMGASIVESENRSLFISQFMELGLRGTVAYHVLSACFREGRVHEYSKTVDQSDGRYISQRVPNRQDRVYLRVAINASCDAVVSHDFSDFPRRVRRDFSRKYGIPIVTAVDAPGV